MGSMNVESINVKHDTTACSKEFNLEISSKQKHISREILCIFIISIIAVFSRHFILCGQIKDYFVLFSKVLFRE